MGYIDGFGNQHGWEDRSRQFEYLDLEQQQIDCSKFGGETINGIVQVNLLEVEGNAERVGEVLYGTAFIPQRSSRQLVYRKHGEVDMWIASKPL